MKKFYFGTNTKMSMTDKEAILYLKELSEKSGDFIKGGGCTRLFDSLCLFVIPSFTVLSRAADILNGSGITLGAQNMCFEEIGQYTGEISPLSLKECGAEIAEIGHSERRHVFSETDGAIRKKVFKAFALSLTPLLCVGETKQQKHTGISDEVLSIQLKGALAGLSEKFADSQAEKFHFGIALMIAYEPVWAIGTGGTPAGPEYVATRCAVIKKVLKSLFGDALAAKMPVLYGGSVNLENAKTYASLADVDGLFVGRAAWTAEGYFNIVKEALAAKR